MNKTILFLIIILFILLSSDWINENVIYLFPTGSRHIILLGTFISLYILNKREENLQISKNSIFLFFILSFIILLSYNIEPPFISFILSFFSIFLFFIIFILGLNIKISVYSFYGLVKSIIIIIFVLSLQPLCQALINGEVLRYNFGLFREVGAYGSFMTRAAIFCLLIYKQTAKKVYFFRRFQKISTN
jgi:hypothetical protein